MDSDKYNEVRIAALYHVGTNKYVGIVSFKRNKIHEKRLSELIHTEIEYELDTYFIDDIKITITEDGMSDDVRVYLTKC